MAAAAATLALAAAVAAAYFALEAAARGDPTVQDKAAASFTVLKSSYAYEEDADSDADGNGDGTRTKSGKPDVAESDADEVVRKVSTENLARGDVQNNPGGKIAAGEGGGVEMSSSPDANEGRVTDKTEEAETECRVEFGASGRRRKRRKTAAGDKRNVAQPEVSE